MSRPQTASPPCRSLVPRGSLLPLLLMVLLLGGCGEKPSEESRPSEPSATDSPPPTRATPDVIAGAAPGTVPELAWDDLMPRGWRPDRPAPDDDADALADDDPRAVERMAQLRALWADAPVVDGLDGHRVRLAGIVVPIEAGAGGVAEFLLVPYFGACIHVPPPPPNQTVHVLTAGGKPYRGELFDTVWVQGRMRVERYSSEIGDAGYRIDDAAVSAYAEES